MSLATVSYLCVPKSGAVTPRENGASKINFGGKLFMVFEKVKGILAEQFDVEEDTITMDTNLEDDLSADSLDVVDLLMSIEDEFEVEIPDEEIENIRTVSELVSYIEGIN